MGPDRSSSIATSGASLSDLAFRLFRNRIISAFSVLLAVALSAPACAAPVPTDEDQEILVKATLLTFNDANLTGNYTVLYDKAAQVFRAQITLQKLVDGFKVYRDKKINLESIVVADMDAGNKATINAEGVLTIKGKFKDDEKRIRFDLQYVNEEGGWKMIGINVSYKEE